MVDRTLIDVFFQKVFSATKAVSAVIVVLCLAAAAVLGAKLVIGFEDPLEVPAFVRESPEGEEGGDDGEEAVLNAKASQVYEEVGQDLEDVMRKYEIGAHRYTTGSGSEAKIDQDAWNKWLTRSVRSMVREVVEEEDWDVEDLVAYIDGSVSYLDAARKAHVPQKSEDNPFDAGPHFKEFSDKFDDAIKAQKRSEVRAEGEKTEARMQLAMILMSLLGFLVLPLLIQIERNTRRDASA